MHTSNRPVWVWPIIIIAILFGLLTIKSGGSVIFFDGPARQAAGNYVNFVVWFNFIAGFFYILTGIGFLLSKPWTAKLAASIAIATLIIFAAFGVHILLDGSYEMRTVIAMTLRSTIWLVFAFAAYSLVNKAKQHSNL